jgi:ESS family glutamate:Na+ symporter
MAQSLASKAPLPTWDLKMVFDIGLGIATIGLLSAIIFGATMSNIARPGKEEMKMDDFEPPSTKDEASLPFQLALLGVTILLGWAMLAFLQWAENTLVNPDAFEIMAYVPLFPLAMIAGLIIQKIILRLSLQNHVSREKINNLTNLALDLLIISALGSLSIKVLADNWQILAILALGGICVQCTDLLYNFQESFWTKLEIAGSW